MISPYFSYFAHFPKYTSVFIESHDQTNVALSPERVKNVSHKKKGVWRAAQSISQDFPVFRMFLETLTMPVSPEKCVSQSG
jgi:hypothetical protein